jgi:amidophosphoribosyltransferase
LTVEFESPTQVYICIHIHIIILSISKSCAKMCGIAGVSLSNPHLCAASDLLEAAVLLQHRGEDACGIACGSTDGKAFILKGVGLVTDVFEKESIAESDLVGSFGIGHGK